MIKEEKEKIEVVKQMIADGQISREVAEIYFPELKESEDERIRKAIIDIINNGYSEYAKEFTHQDLTTWLEKKGNIDLEFFENGENEKREFVGYGFLKCKGDFLSFKEGETYWLEYIGKDNYNVRSDNLLGQTFHITPQQLYTVFRPTTWLEKQGEKFQHWKPSEEQLEALDYAYNSCPDTERGNYYEGVLETIIDDLHKLSEKQGEQKKPVFEMKTSEESLCIDSDTYRKIVDECIFGEQKPDYCHHEVDLSNCSEEYRKAYYDGWNNCNMQHSQCKSESNDVVKCLINGMKFYYEDNDEWGTDKFSMKVKDILSWLEKQCEQKSFDYENANIQQKDFAPKVEPKFHEGDWVVQENIGVYKVIEICESWYEVIDAEDNHYSISFDKEYMCRLWDITKDAKDGDVLYSPCCKLLWIYKDGNSCYIGNNLNYNENCVVVNNPICIPTDVVPATKEQRDQLKKAMADAGYTFDFEKKELKKIEDEPAWSEKDEKMVESIITDIKYCKKAYNNYSFHENEIDWLKSLKDRVGCEVNCTTTKEWSEEDEKRTERLHGWLDTLINYIHQDVTVSLNIRRERMQQVEQLKTWFKSLKERI